MIIKEMESYITCSKCGHGFTYSTLHTREKLETMYDDIFKIHMGECAHCREGFMTIQEAKFKVDNDKDKEYVVRWQCLSCQAKWTQFDNYTAKKNISIGRALEKLKSETTCPMCYTKNVRVLSMHRA
jgi:Zn finger protein HypA/HybF involved in hydrogenase expression